jgi:hypothetical protein
VRFEVSGAPPWWIAFCDLDGVQQRFEAADLFDALSAAREYFDARGCALLCAGARRDVWPSRMSRSMGGGRKAYITELGKQARRACLIGIFDHAAPETIGTVEEQRAYHRDWIDSLGEYGEKHSPLRS